MNVQFSIYKASALPTLKINLDYGANVRLAEVKFYTGYFPSDKPSKHRWRLTLFSPSGRVQTAFDCDELLKVANAIDKHIMSWFNNSIGDTSLHVYLREAVRSQFERDEEYMQEHCLTF